MDVRVGVIVYTTPKVGVEVGVGLAVADVSVGDGVAVVVKLVVAVTVPVPGVPFVAVCEAVGESVRVSVAAC
jgi:hypothetical protein